MLRTIFKFEASSLRAAGEAIHWVQLNQLVLSEMRHKLLRQLLVRLCAWVPVRAYSVFFVLHIKFQHRNFSFRKILLEKRGSFFDRAAQVLPHNAEARNYGCFRRIAVHALKKLAVAAYECVYALFFCRV